jgi:hydrogenase maturation protease
MNAALVDGIVRAVLYEGYMLYPYRPSAVKNGQRFNFGVIYPRAYSEAQGGTDACTIQTECLVEGNAETQCTVRVRFLRMVTRSIGKPQSHSAEASSHVEGDFAPRERLEISPEGYQPWQEAAEETIELTEFQLSALAGQPMQWPFRLSAKQEREPICDERGAVAAVILREKRTIAGSVELSATQLAPGLFKLRVLISNDSRLESSCVTSREAALDRSLVSAHTILEVRDGEFVSLVDPPEGCRDWAKECQNVGTWPILVGDTGEHDTMLSSPIILYDYPEIAPESPGDLFDSAEIDEILSLRILTMTENEKREMRESDERARQILERTETMPEEQWMKLHGALRGLRRVKRDTP